MQSVPPLVLWLLVPTLAILVALHALDTWRRSGRTRQLLAGRERLSPAAFGQRYFPDNQEEADLAAAIRKALARHLARDLDGLHPDDRLWEDLHIDLEGDPDSFRSLEEKLEIDLIGKDAEKFLEVQPSVKTFRDLVAAARRASPNQTSVPTGAP